MGFLKNVPDVRAQSMREILYEHLRKAIVCGDLKAGDMFTDQEIADEFGVSRTPAREALQKLESTGFIERIPMKGNRVCGLSAQELAHTFSIRKALETLAVQYAAVRITDEELARMSEVLDALDVLYAGTLDKEEKIEAIFAHIKTYNEIAFGACRSQRLTESVWAQREVFDRYRVMRLVLPNRVERSIGRRRELYEAFRAHDPDKARSIWSEHLDESFAIWREKSGYGPELEGFRFF